MTTRYGVDKRRYDSGVAYHLPVGLVGRPRIEAIVTADDTKDDTDKITDNARNDKADSVDTGDRDSGSGGGHTILEGGDGAEVVPPVLVARRGSGAAGRLAGMLATLLGLVGCLLSFALLAVSIRFGFSAPDVAERTAEPLTAAVDRLETRIDQADDLIDRDGVSDSEFNELQARIDGLADTATSASQSFAAIDDHVLYRWLPIDKSELATALADFKQGSDEAVGITVTAEELEPAQAARIADRVNEMQTSVSGTADLIESTIDSLKNWIRLSALGGFVLSLWSLWAQVSLMKRGWRGLRGERP